MLFKNVASQKIHVYAYDSTTGAAKTGDAGNITGYVSLDGTANAIDDTNPTEVDATNMPGLYCFDLTQAETNCNAFALVAKSSTSNIRIEPIIGYTTGAAVTQTGDAYARLGAPAGASVSADIAAVKAETASILEDTGTTLDGKINTIDDFLDTEIAAIKAKTDNLPASPANEATLSTIAGYLDTEIAAILADTNELQTDWANGGRLDLILDAASAPSAAAVADAVWDEALSGHSNAGSAGLALATASSGGVDPSVLADAIWDEALSGHATAGTAGKKLTDLANADLSGVATAAALTTVDGIVDAIKAKTDNLPASPAAVGSAMTLTAAYDAAKTAATQASVDVVDGIVDNILIDTAVIGAAGAGLTAIPWNASWDAEVQSECTDALNAYDPPTNAEMEARTLAAADYATAANLATVDTVVDGVKTVTDKIDTALELDGAVYRYTENALEQAPAGGGSSLTVEAIVDGVLDEMLSEHTDVGSAGAGIAAAGSSGDPWATALPGAYAEGTAGNIIGSLSTPGSGSTLRVYSLTESTSGNPIVGATVTVTTDIAGTVVVASGTTDSGGIVEFYLDAGTYYLWRSCTGYTFTDPDTEVFV